MAIDSAAFVRKVLDIYNSHDVARFDEILAEDCVLVRNGIEARGRAAVEQVLARLYAALPDVEFQADDVLAAGDKMALRWTGRGTHRGDYMGVPPSGRTITYDGITIYQLDDQGRIARIWVTASLAGLRSAPRVTPTSPEARV